MNKLLVLSAGHGSGDPGAVANGQEEHYWNVQICNRVKLYCDGWGMPCDYLPTENGNLSNQIATVNAIYKNLNDGYALQVHLNAGGGNGCEFWKPSHSSGENQAMAESILNSVIDYTGLKNRGIKDASTNQWGKLGWTDDTNTWAGLIESWFIDVNPSNPEIANKVAYGIARGVCNYFGVKSGGDIEIKPPIVTPPVVKPTVPVVEPPKPVEPPIVVITPVIESPVVITPPEPPTNIVITSKPGVDNPTYRNMTMFEIIKKYIIEFISSLINKMKGGK